MCMRVPKFTVPPSLRLPAKIGLFCALVAGHNAQNVAQDRGAPKSVQDALGLVAAPGRFVIEQVARAVEEPTTAGNDLQQPSDEWSAIQEVVARGRPTGHAPKSPFRYRPDGSPRKSQEPN